MPNRLSPGTASKNAEPSLVEQAKALSNQNRQKVKYNEAHFELLCAVFDREISAVQAAKVLGVFVAGRQRVNQQFLVRLMREAWEAGFIGRTK